MGAYQAPVAASESARSATQDQYACCCGGDPLYPFNRLPVAGIAAGVPALLDGARLFLRVAGYRPVGMDRQRPCPAGAGKLGSTPKPTAAVIDSQSAPTTQA